jgi:uncharacterized membrane protein
MIISKVFLVNHLIASIVWVGAVYMGAFIDWPAAQKSVPRGQFPFRFIIGQGRGVFFSVYFAIFLLWVSGFGMILTGPPLNKVQFILAGVKIGCLSVMTLFTMYGTFFSWKKIQLATHEEAFRIYKYYMYRAYTTFSCGIIASVVGIFFR